MKTKIILFLLLLTALKSQGSVIPLLYQQWVRRETSTTDMGYREVNGNRIYILKTESGFTYTSLRNATTQFIRTHRGIKMQQNWTRIPQGYACIILPQSHYRIIVVYLPTKGEIHIMGTMDKNPFNHKIDEIFGW